MLGRDRAFGGDRAGLAEQVEQRAQFGEALVAQPAHLLGRGARDGVARANREGVGVQDQEGQQMPEGVVHLGREAAAFVGARGTRHRRALTCECGQPVVAGPVQPLGEAGAEPAEDRHGRAHRRGQPDSGPMGAGDEDVRQRDQAGEPQLTWSGGVVHRPYGRPRQGDRHPGHRLGRHQLLPGRVDDDQQGRHGGDGGHPRVRAGAQADQDPGRGELGEQASAQRGRQGGERAGEYGGAETGTEDGDRHEDHRQASHHAAGAAVRHARTVADIPR